MQISQDHPIFGVSATKNVSIKQLGIGIFNVSGTVFASGFRRFAEISHKLESATSCEKTSVQLQDIVFASVVREVNPKYSGQSVCDGVICGGMRKIYRKFSQNPQYNRKNTVCAPSGQQWAAAFVNEPQSPSPNDNTAPYLPVWAAKGSSFYQ